MNGGRREWRRTFLIGAVAAVLTIGTVLVWRTSGRDTPMLRQADPSAGPDTAAPLSADPSASTESAPTTGLSMPLWRVVDERDAPVQPAYPATWSEAGRALVDVSGVSAAARAWETGDMISIPLPQLGVSYEGGIERIDEGPGYSRSARGWASDGVGRARRFVVTVGPTRVLAYIDTAEGPYELVADTRIGWLLPTSSMLAGIDFTESDYIIPDLDRPADSDSPVR